MTNILQNWKKYARKSQENFYYSLGDRVWDEIEKPYLHQKIGFGFFGCPQKKVSDTLEYEDGQKEIIDKVCKTVVSLHSGNTVRVAFIYVLFHVKGKNGKQGVQPLCKIPEGETDNDLFIDPHCRVYKGWADYLEKNKLPRCVMCYPNNGIYNLNDGIVDIKFTKSHVCDVSSMILTGFDITSTMLTVGATGVTVASLAFPIATPFVMGAFGTLIASGTYDISRNAYKLYDIKGHFGSLGLENSDSRRAWLNLAGSAVGVASVGTTAVAKSVTVGTTLERSSLVALRALNISSVAITGIGVANSLITVVLKLLNGTLDNQDIIQFIQICFFFMNAIVTQNIAHSILSDIASGSVENLFCLAKNTAHCYTRSMIEFKDSSNYILLRNLLLGCQARFMPSIDFNFIETISFDIINFIHSLTSKYIDWEKFSSHVTKILCNIWAKYRDTMLEAVDEVGQVLNVKNWKSAFCLQNVNEFTYISPDAAQQILCIANQTALQCSHNLSESKERAKIIVEFGNKFNAVQPSVNEIEYIHKLKYISQYLIQQYDLVKEQYETKLDNESSNQNFNQKEFDKNYGIVGRREEYFFLKATETLNTESRLKELSRNYYVDVAEGVVPPPKDLLSFDCSISTLYTFCGPLGKKEFSDKEYLDKARCLTGIDVNLSNARLEREGDIVFIQLSPNQPCKSMLFYTTYVKESLIGQLLVLKKLYPLVYGNNH